MSEKTNSSFTVKKDRVSNDVETPPINFPNIPSNIFQKTECFKESRIKSIDVIMQRKSKNVYIITIIINS